MDDEGLLNERSAYKVIVVGGTGVGKTSIVQRYSTGVFHEQEQTIGAGYLKCVVSLESGEVSLNVWDTAGQEKFQSLIPLYLRGADGCILVFDLTNPSPTESLDNLYKYIQNHMEEKMFVVLCGNKFDLVSSGSEPSGVVSWAALHELDYFKTSAVTGQSIDELFIAVARGVKAQKEHEALIVGSVHRRKSNTDCCT
jgi:small GTP-binding protein